MKLARLALDELRQDRTGALLLSLAVAVGVGALAFFVSLGLGATRTVRQLFPDAARTVEVIPPPFRLGGFLDARLDDGAVERLRELPEVVDVEREMLLRVPASTTYRGNFFGAPVDLGFEVAAVGVDRGLVASDLPAGASWEAPGGGPVPACISDRLLALYDTTFAPSRGLPTLTASALLGFTLPVTVGRSLVAASSGPALDAAVRIACVSSRALLAGLTVPLPVIRDWNRRGGRDSETYSSVALTAKSADALPKLVADVQRLGFAVDSGERRSARLAGEAVAIFTLVLGLLALAITALAAAAIGQSLTLSVRARRRELGLLRALGATPGDAAALVLWEAAIVGAAGGCAGLAGAVAAARLADSIMARLLPAFPGRPPSFFALSPGLALAVLGVALAAALAGALAPARLAARLDPSRALSG